MLKLTQNRLILVHNVATSVAPCLHITYIIIIIISNLSNDRSEASSKTIPPHSEI